MTVYDDQKQGVATDDELRHIVGISKDEEDAYEREALREAEETPSLYKREDENGDDSLPQKLLGKLNKKQAYGAGGILGLIITAVIFISTIGSGPLEFIHLSQILHLAHFAQQEAAGDTRLVKMYRYLTNKGDVAGDTEIGALTDEYRVQMLDELETIGIKPQYNADGSYDKFTIDTEDANSPYKGMSPKAAAQEFADNTGITPTVNGTTLEVDGANFWGSSEAAANSLSKMGLSSVATAARARIEEKFGLASMHPMEVVDDQDYDTQAKVDTYLDKEWDEWVNNGVEPASIDASGAVEENTVNGKPVTTDVPGSVDASQAGISNDLTEIADSGSMEAAGPASVGVGLACAVEAVNNSIPLVRNVRDIYPLMRDGMSVMSVGYQIMSGQGFTLANLSYLSSKFTQTDSGGNVISTWYDDPGIRADMGESTAGMTDPLKKDGTYDLIQNQNGPSWTSWANSAPIKDLCGPVGQRVVGGVGITVGIFSGAALATAAGLIVTSLVAPGAISHVAQLLGGKMVDLAEGGATWGGNADYGVALGANDTAGHSGGVALSTTQANQLTYADQQQQKSAFDSESLFARVFDIDNYQSLTGRLADSMLSTSFTGNIMGLVGDITGSTSTLMKLPFSIFSSIASAAAPQSSYAYPWPEIDFSQADLNNPEVGNPYTNAADVAHTLDTSCLNNDGTTNSSCSYITQAESCFGDEITKDNTQHVWDVIPNEPIDFYSSSYNTTLCQGNGPNDAWLRMRFFILDTGVIEGYSCVELHDPVACSDDGTSGDDTNTESSSNGDAFTGILPNYGANVASVLTGRLF